MLYGIVKKYSMTIQRICNTFNFLREKSTHVLIMNAVLVVNSCFSGVSYFDVTSQQARNHQSSLPTLEMFAMQ